MGKAETYQIIKENGGKIRAPDLFTKIPWSKDSIKKSIRKLKWEGALYIVPDLDGEDLLIIIDNEKNTIPK